MSNDCLTDEQLEEFAAGRASVEQAARVEEHIRSCPACRDRLKQRQTQEAFLDDIRGTYDQAKARASSAGHVRDDLIPGYRIVEELHRGGQGVVFKAVQLSTERTVALKVILGGPFAAPEARKRFEREAKLAASLSHPNVVAVHDSGVVDDNLYIVMDCVEGTAITDYAAAGRLSIGDKLKLFATVCEAVEYAHQHEVLHRDLKPANILVDEEGEPVIVDFGLARPLHAGRDGASVTVVSAPGQVVGSLPYISPDQAAGDPSQIDERTDVYALGVLLYELVTGARPPPVLPATTEKNPSHTEIEPTAPSQASIGLDARLDRIVLKALQRDKIRRYRSAGDLATVVRTYLDSPAPKFRWGVRPLLVRSLAAMMILYALAVTYLVVHFFREAMRRPPIFTVEPEWPSQAVGPSLLPPPEYDLRMANDQPLVTFTFDEGYWPGLNPPLLAFDPNDSFAIRPPHQTRPLWEHFEGPNRAGSEGWSNLYVTRRWFRSGLCSLRSKTGIARSGRVNSLYIPEHVESTDRLYYELWFHLLGTKHDSFTCGFVTISPARHAPEHVQHFFTNSVEFVVDRFVFWGAHHSGKRLTTKIAEWPQGREFVCLLRVEMDFPNERAQVWIDGRHRGVDLPLTPKDYYDDRVSGNRFRLNRWGFQGPANYNQESLGGHPDLMFQPGYADIDDLEIGAWIESTASMPEPSYGPVP